MWFTHSSTIAVVAVPGLLNNGTQAGVLRTRACRIANKWRKPIDIDSRCETRATNQKLQRGQLGVAACNHDSSYAVQFSAHRLHSTRHHTIA
jgi:hypothetical protein